MRAIYNSVRCSHFARCLMNCYTRISNGFDLELINYDQIYYNLTIGSRYSSIYFKQINIHNACTSLEYQNKVICVCSTFYFKVTFGLYAFKLLCIYNQVVATLRDSNPHLWFHEPDSQFARSRIRLSWATHYVGDLRYDCSVTCPSVLDHSPCWGSQV